MEIENNEGFFPNLIQRTTKRGLGAKPILESQIKAAQDNSSSAMEAARVLGVSYNTYKKYGLPPGPIGNPGVAAMTAALNPTSGDWLYFITVAPGDTRFTKSIDEFNAWKALYTKNRKAGAFN